MENKEVGPPPKATNSAGPNLAPNTDLPFEVALRALKDGQRVRRRPWRSFQAFIVYMPSLNLPPFNTQKPGPKVNDRTAKWIGPDTPLECRPYIAYYIGVTNGWTPGWFPSQEDIFATDWEIDTTEAYPLQ